MAFLRPEVAAALRKWREVIALFAAAMVGLWVLQLGGWFLALIGVTVLIVSVVLGLAAYRRVAFNRDVAAPGVVEVDEGQISYLSPTGIGGQIELRALDEISLLSLRGVPMWRLRGQGQALLIPLDAAGAPALVGAFQALSGFDLAAAHHAVAKLPKGPALVALQPTRMQSVWRRADDPRLT